MKLILALAAGVAGTTLATAAFAAPEGFTTRSASYALVANCPGGPLGNVCEPGRSVPIGTFDTFAGTEDYDPTHLGGLTDVYARLPGPGVLSYGSAVAFTVYEDGALTPTLKAGAFTQPTELGRYVTAYSYVSTLAAYHYGGEEAVALPLVGKIDFQISFAPIDYADPFAVGSLPYSFGHLRARLLIGTAEIWKGAALRADDVVCGAAWVMATDSDIMGRGGYASGGATQNLVMTLDATIGCDGNPVVINPGQDFYIYAFLETLAIQGAFTNATNSFHIELAEDTPDAVREALAAGVARIATVPEPGTWAMLVAGFGLVGGVARRRRELTLA